jgi:hypothetical protein
MRASGLRHERGCKLVAVEAGNQLKWIAETLKKIEGVLVHVGHPKDVKWITESRGKTDPVDAKKLAQLVRDDIPRISDGAGFLPIVSCQCVEQPGSSGLEHTKRNVIRQ